MSTTFNNPLSIPVLGFCAYSGTGKTTLLKQLIPALTQRGLRLAVLKHAHHNFDVDIPGKDSYEMRKAGARQMLVASHVRWALMTEDECDGDPDLVHLLQQLEADKVDLVLVEGFKKLALPKIELHRQAVGKPLIFDQDPNVLAIACCADTQLPHDINIDQLDINNVAQIADYVEQYAQNYQGKPSVRPLPLQALSSSGSFLSVRQGIENILAHVAAVAQNDIVSLDDAENRVLAEDAISPVDVPQNTNSAMDGFAFSAAEPMPEAFEVVGEVRAGYQYDGSLQAGQAVRIMTGAPVPAGADTVQPRENATEQDGRVSLQGKIKVGQNVRLAGEDIAKGAVALAAGSRLGAAEQGLLASLGFAEFAVKRRPVVAVFSSGDEVSQPGTELKANCIYDSNRYTIKSMARRLGCEVIDLGIIEDSEAALTAALSQASIQADVVISSGGVSVGNADYIKKVLAAIGEIHFWRIDMRPGRPLAFGKINDALFFGLPGNPVAAMVVFLMFVQPALRKLAGEQAWQPQMLPAIADEPFRSRVGRTEFNRGIAALGTDGKLHVRSTGGQGSGMLSSMVKGNCLVIVGEADERIEVGELVYILPFAELL
ncbi:bifunctional molybdopterin-guanine dinucleotide biosynthesis adaptor protein MobB/molybdopterin molybdotransferase MoeA [Shewanella sp. C32]|uniref:Molybdopterin molybdenumtransferase n=1 Tax=Shewanella electrica TaxID=515560 RepID=A0ABT2FLS3_9GAMM|nr:bifunctional molybdopterin-guanine dinucleotide biosynthesis adaptor protein MobB/molybdopterin molybdotransferase MoeA [Shewanella electrica]MCH1925841.1 bifunctional molybdopterin-guanine dinucleotide biosynthesis adaptor protein MobB/molybdopterin molybdotransferase MoeA [Shewanella electrica]MCS4557274.1 bifunctional molybdopterin-guanine dinucleotide biosynthesis adaptor protein MobB/molybdopterin molybdotransferase MoeA [Shewanella electrica]